MCKKINNCIFILNSNFLKPPLKILIEGVNKMSADNWAICPRCKKQHEKSVEDRKKKVEKKYGKIPSNEYLELMKKSKEKLKLEVSTLREDYEIRVDVDGHFEIKYSCHCWVCKLEHVFNHTEQLEI